MLVRAYIEESGKVRIVHANGAGRRMGESDDDLMGRVCRQAIAADASLEGLLFVTVESGTLPKDRATRDRWRVVKGKVVVEPLPKRRKKKASGRR